jgi:hypothetical protein
MFIFWGPQYIKIYNDGYRPITGDKHPWALGRPGTEVWPEIWDDIGPMVERVVRHGEATWSDDLRLFMHRRGFPEEVTSRLLPRKADSPLAQLVEVRNE